MCDGEASHGQSVSSVEVYLKERPNALELIGRGAQTLRPFPLATCFLFCPVRRAPSFSHNEFIN